MAHLTRLSLAVALAALSISAVGCGDAAAPDGGNGNADAGDTAGAGDGGEADENTEGGSDSNGDDANADEAPVGMISSGTQAAPPTLVPPAPVEQSSDVRRVTLDDARASVPFTILEPTALPDESYLDGVRLLEPSGDETVPGLPAVVLIYTIDSADSFVLRQSAAGVEPADEPDASAGEDIAVGSYTAKAVDVAGIDYLIWEQDGVRLRLNSGSLGPDFLAGIGAGLSPGQ